MFMHGTSFAQEFQCAPYVYQLASATGGDPSTLYSYNINTGTTTTVANFCPCLLMRQSYSTVDSLIIRAGIRHIIK